MKYTISQFRADFPDDAACLDRIFTVKYPNLKGKYYRVKKIPRYTNAAGTKHIHPLKGTIFEKTTTPLTLWFYAIYLFSAAKNGVSAKELQRQLGVSYKCAFRMASRIRSLMSDDDTGSKLNGTVEADEMYVGGKKSGAGRGIATKQTVIGVVERKGRAKVSHLLNPVVGKFWQFITEQVFFGSRVMTDEHSGYLPLKEKGYDHHTLNHQQGEYYRSGGIHGNTIEGLWSYIKRNLLATYGGRVTPEYLQSYLNLYTFHYNHRWSDYERFQALISRI